MLVKFSINEAFKYQEKYYFFLAKNEQGLLLLIQINDIANFTRQQCRAKYANPCAYNAGIFDALTMPLFLSWRFFRSLPYLKMVIHHISLTVFLQFAHRGLSQYSRVLIFFVSPLKLYFSSLRTVKRARLGYARNTMLKKCFI